MKLKFPIACILFVFFPLLLVASGFVPHTQLRVEGDRFLINKVPTDIYGIRLASGSQSDGLTRSLIRNLDEYKRYGVNAVTFFLQGSSGGYADPFSEDGTTIDPEHLRRAQQIVEACDQRGMIVIVGIFYQRVMINMKDSRRINSAEAVFEAVRTVAKAFEAYDNIIINVVNEQSSGYYGGVPFFDFRKPESIIELCRIVHEVDADRLVGSGGYFDLPNVMIGRSPEVDVLLFDTFTDDVVADQDSGWHYDYFVENGVVGKPIINVESFGGWTKRCVSEEGFPGYYSPDDKALHLREIDAAASRPGLSVFFHSNPWCQGPSMGQPTRYDLGGEGTADDLGIRWWFEYVATTLEKAKGTESVSTVDEVITLDFKETEISGCLKYYKDTKHGAFAIDASKETNRIGFACAQAVFSGPSGRYDFDLKTLGEIDGESSYRIRVNGKIVGSYQNAPTAIDYVENHFKVPAIQLNNGDLIVVESSAHTNGKIPEKGSTAWARGRWCSLVLSASK